MLKCASFADYNEPQENLKIFIRKRPTNILTCNISAGLSSNDFYGVEYIST